MAKNNLIAVHCLGLEVGLLGFDENRGASFFQYHEVFLKMDQYRQLFPAIFRRIKQTQVFDKYNNETFRGLPPIIADSLPDLFGNIVFKAWIESAGRDIKEISVLEQLSYVGTRGMGALEYHPSKTVPSTNSISIEAITEVVKQVLDQKNNIREERMDHTSLLNIFKIGTSAGGMRPKILVAEHKTNGTVIPGDIVIDDQYHYYLVKLGIDEANYSRELIEYSYYLAATQAGITMMECKMIEDKHFATLRFDRQGGRKKHVLTATGLTGLDYKDPKVSSYENLFELLLYLKCPHKDSEELFRRMVFNLVFANHDDHLKNQSFIYNEEQDRWHLAPAYDLTYSLNPELHLKTTSRALSLNGKRVGIELTDLKAIAEKYTIKNYKKIIAEVQEATSYWEQEATALCIPKQIITTISKHFSFFGLI
jgi:serine/threonine-protein kinase HipA